MNHNKTIFLSILVSLSGLLLNCENEPVGITFTDSDGDGVYDAVDNCPLAANPNQEDSDGDGINDGLELLSNPLDGCDPNPLSPGCDSDGDLLSNPEDDKTTSVFLPVNRYNTDRSVLKFRKPKN